ncbi:MAG: SHOCT domain-containing protein [Myxococcales bacterium]|nr:SHOCT domain-containing protein [Myxococcales bacterium]
MTNGRLVAALLFLLGLACFVGQIAERLPEYFVFIATGCYVLGAICHFVSGPGKAPVTTVAAAPPARTLAAPTQAPAPPPVVAQHGEVVEMDDPSALDTDVFEVTGDISLPLDVQEERQLGAELEKLQRLHRSGSLSDAEYEKAKARLLD